MGKNDKLALLLDFDGTLAPLVSHPSLSKMDPQSEVALRSLTQNSDVYVAIISGRSADDAREIAKFDNITYAGNHINKQILLFDFINFVSDFCFLLF